jgi:hypothetical protein
VLRLYTIGSNIPRELLSMSFFLIDCEFVDQLRRAALEC